MSPLRKSASPEILTATELARERVRRLASKHLEPFIELFWPLIEPGTPYVPGWHISAICQHLEAITDFQISRLIINMPPRHGKSIIVSVMWPAWVWVNHPERRFIFASYSGQLSSRDATKMRTIVESDLYRELFRPTWQLRDDQNQKVKFENSLFGFRFSTSVGGTVTGEGADHVCADDPLNSIDSNSEIIRAEANEFCEKVLATRVNNAKKGSRVIIMQRLHEEDPTGHLLKTGKWDHLVLPARFEPKSEVVSKTTLNFKDPRTKDGELLWPERFDDEAIKSLEQAGDSHAQLQQSPKPKSGGIFKRDWWKLYDTAPSPVLEVVQFWDCAQKPGITNDYSVCATWARTHNGFFLLDLWREKTEGPILESMAIALYEKWRPNAVVIEDKSAGSSLIQYLLRGTHIPVLPFNPGQNDKEVRAIAATPTVQAGKCFLPRAAAWLEDFIKEHEKFPRASHDDQVDTTSMMVEYFNKRFAAAPRVRSV